MHNIIYAYIQIFQIHPGTGFVLEQYNGDKTKTLVSYLVDVRRIYISYTSTRMSCSLLYVLAHFDCFFFFSVCTA